MSEQVYIFGAHSRATTLGTYLTKLNKDLVIKAYIIDNEESNPSNVDGVPVLHLDKLNDKLNISCPVYIGTRGVFHQNVIDRLIRIGFNNIIPVTPKFDMKLRNEFLKSYFEEQGREFVKLDELKLDFNLNSKGQHGFGDIALYVVKSSFDKPQEHDYSSFPYERDIQVGAELTETRVADILDNVDNNISYRNKQFCELTGLYWIWKNANEKIVGLEHYRRHFILPDDWVSRIVNNEIDVVLPVPLYVGPSIEGNYIARHEEAYWNYMLEYFKDNRPDEFDKLSRFFKETSLYSPCNMFIMKRDVLNELCSWLFPVLFYVADKGGIIDDTYQNRYPGFLSERLITYFFEANRDKYRVVYADKDFRQ